VILVLDPLDDIALRRILTEPDDAVFRHFQALFAMSGVQLKASEEALVAIAREARHRGVGARGLRAALENLFLDTMFNLPDLKGVGALHLRGSSYHNLRLVFSTGTQSRREKELHDVGQF
jgi:ATP-dependent Clp protease ATP-binding subunit ClpX